MANTRIINGHKIGDSIGIFTPDKKSLETQVIRRVGIAGFQIKGLATCFYWHEKGSTWDDIPKANH